MFKFKFFVVLCAVFLSSLAASEQETPRVLVSLSPHEYFVERIGGKTLAPLTLVPPGVSAHSYEPTPKQMLEAIKGKVWFRMGESFEQKLLKSFKFHTPDMLIVDLRENIDLLPAEDGHRCHVHECEDLHFWLSPRLMKTQVETISHTLITRFKEHKDVYAKNTKIVLDELTKLDQEITSTLAGLKNRTIAVSHPDFGYFAKDYNLKQIAIEIEGKEPSTKQVMGLLAKLKENEIKTIFVQKQHNLKAAHAIAEQIGAKVVIIDLFEKDYFKSLQKIAEQIAQKD